MDHNETQSTRLLSSPFLHQRNPINTKYLFSTHDGMTHDACQGLYHIIYVLDSPHFPLKICFLTHNQPWYQGLLDSNKYLYRHPPIFFSLFFFFLQVCGAISFVFPFAVVLGQ